MFGCAFVNRALCLHNVWSTYECLLLLFFNRQGNYQFKRSTTTVLNTKIIPIEVETSQTFSRTLEGKKESEKMDTSS